MTTTNTGNTTAGATAAAGPARGATSLTSAADQQDRFMKLLVAQMKNQDPLNPMDNAQMTSQIAQINTVGGIEKLNTTVQSLVSAFSRMQAQSASQLAGREVLVQGTRLQLADGQAATGGVELAAPADAVSVEVVGADGAVVRTLALGASPAGVRTFTWDGRTGDGSTAPSGDYRIRIKASTSGKDVEAVALTRAHVQSVATATEGVQLDLGPAGVKPMDAVKSYL